MSFVNNHAIVFGNILTEPSLAHTLYGECFYTFTISVPRLSKSRDDLPVTIHERVLNEAGPLTVGAEIGISGQIRSYNKLIDGQNRLVITLFARSLFTEVREGCPNYVALHGTLCKQPIYRTTPFGREIADLLLAVGRAYGKSDYIPCITWGRNARISKELDVGQRIEIIGRIQSRLYQKKLPDDDVIEKIAYEVSVSGISLWNGQEKQ